jgi:hypothetical protein
MRTISLVFRRVGERAAGRAFVKETNEKLVKCEPGLRRTWEVEEVSV